VYDLVVKVYILPFKSEQFSSADTAIYEQIHNSLPLDRLIFKQFKNVPFDTETECIEEPFLHFPVGTNMEDILNWFDDNYSEDMSRLMSIS
jgi:hypothetical protein